MGRLRWARLDEFNDVAMIRMRKEANAQGLSTVKVWACSIACYTKAFLAQGGSDAEGTYLFLNSLPFEEAGTNQADQAYVNALGSKVDSFGANGWQAALAFEQAVKSVVERSGPNGLTPASLLTALKGVTNFSADGWIGPKALQGPGSFSPCYLIVQVRKGKYVRVYPAKPGTMDCNPSNLVTSAWTRSPRGQRSSSHAERARRSRCAPWDTSVRGGEHVRAAPDVWLATLEKLPRKMRP